ncbi:MAG TPA: PIG-L family deacetylase [Ilumatobacteraceae bacterium]|jgi:LmbE family N-acetylglucosaminyl deacetylase|nr:PIG-L family deacetylase [Ilumatobacteraceae bacterium]
MAERSTIRARRSTAISHVAVGNVTTPITRPLPERLLGVWAHPDDECYLSAGLMARVAAAGGHVRVVCATSGELGTSDPAETGTERFAYSRRIELQSSLDVLGVHDVHFLGLPDGGCRGTDDATMAAVVAGHIEDLGADTVVTFGPDGITGHADHAAVSRWATAAARSGVDVLYATMTHDFAHRHRALHDTIGLFGDLPGGRPRSVHRSHVALQVALDHGELIRKRRALREHGSQTASLAALVGEETYFSWWRDECFRRPTGSEICSARAAAERISVGVET